MWWRSARPRQELRYGCHGCGWSASTWEPAEGADDLEKHDCGRVEPWVGLTSAWRAALLERDGRRARP